MQFTAGKFQCVYIIPTEQKAFNLLCSPQLQLFHERRTFSPLRLPPCGAPRCMGQAVKKRNRFSSIALLRNIEPETGEAY